MIPYTFREGPPSLLPKLRILSTSDMKLLLTWRKSVHNSILHTIRVRPIPNTWKQRSDKDANLIHFVHLLKLANVSIKDFINLGKGVWRKFSSSRRKSLILRIHNHNIVNHLPQFVSRDNSSWEYRFLWIEGIFNSQKVAKPATSAVHKLNIIFFLTFIFSYSQFPPDFLSFSSSLKERDHSFLQSQILS